MSKSYSEYGFEDFLSDSSFIDYVRDPEARRGSLWTNFTTVYPGRAAEFEAAKHFIESAMQAASRDSMTAADKESLWNDISRRNAGLGGKRKQMLRRSLAVAAGVALIAIAGISVLLRTRTVPEPDIVNFARSNAGVTQDLKYTTMIHGAEVHTLTMKTQSVINHGEQEINIDDQRIEQSIDTVYTQLVTPRGARAELTLPDGSKLWLNGGTRVIYPARFATDQREIFVDGEVFMDVAHDDGRPFIVRSNRMNVRVLGTKFNITDYAHHHLGRVVLVEVDLQTKTGY